MKKKKVLNDIEIKIWEAILVYLSDNNVVPLREEIATAISDDNKRFSPQLVQYHLRSLERKGWITLTPKIKRGIKI